MEKLYRLVQERIKTLVTAIKWIDMDEGQLEAFGENAPVDYPCALISFPGTDYSNIGGLQQIGDSVINVRVAFRVYEKFNAAVPALLQTAAFGHFATLKEVMTALHGYQADAEYSPLTRTNWRKEPSIDPKIYNISFAFDMKDTGVGTTFETMEKPELWIE